MSLQENTPMRKRLYGKKVLAGDFAKYVTKRLLGDPAHGVEPMSQVDIMRELGFKDKKSIAEIKKLAMDMKLLEIDEKGNAILPTRSAFTFKQFSKKYPITSEPLVKSWIYAMKFKGHTGKGRKSSSNFVLKIQQVCNELKISPVQLTIDLKTTEDYAQAMFEKIENGEYKTNSSKRTNASVQDKWYQYRMAIRSFSIQSGVSMPKNHGGILNGKTLGHGLYADLSITDEQIEEAERYIIKKHGLDSDIFRIFAFAMESGARKEALLLCDLEWTEETEGDETTFFMKVFESKTEHIDAGIVDKFISRKKTQESLRLAKAKGYSKLWDSKNISHQKFYNYLCIELKDVWNHLGLTSHYWTEKPVHALRHIASHYWLVLTDYDYVFCAEIIGISVQEFIKSYGKMPANIKFKKMKDARRRAKSLDK